MEDVSADRACDKCVLMRREHAMLRLRLRAELENMAAGFEAVSNRTRSTLLVPAPKDAASADDLLSTWMDMFHGVCAMVLHCPYDLADDWRLAKPGTDLSNTRSPFWEHSRGDELDRAALFGSQQGGARKIDSYRLAATERRCGLVEDQIRSLKELLKMHWVSSQRLQKDMKLIQTDLDDAVRESAKLAGEMQELYNERESLCQQLDDKTMQLEQTLMDLFQVEGDFEAASAAKKSLTLQLDHFTSSHHNTAGGGSQDDVLAEGQVEKQDLALLQDKHQDELAEQQRLRVHLDAAVNERDRLKRLLLQVQAQKTFNKSSADPQVCAERDSHMCSQKLQQQLYDLQQAHQDTLAELDRLKADSTLEGLESGSCAVASAVSTLDHLAISVRGIITDLSEVRDGISFQNGHGKVEDLQCQDVGSHFHTESELRRESIDSHCFAALLNARINSLSDGMSALENTGRDLDLKCSEFLLNRSSSVDIQLPNGNVKVMMVLDMGIHEIAGGEDAFIDCVKDDVAKAIHGDKKKVRVLRLETGSKIVHMELEERICEKASGLNTLQAARDLQRQADDPASALMQGTVTSTCKTIEVSVHECAVCGQLFSSEVTAAEHEVSCAVDRLLVGDRADLSTTDQLVLTPPITTKTRIRTLELAVLHETALKEKTLAHLHQVQNELSHMSRDLCELEQMITTQMKHDEGVRKRCAATQDEFSNMLKDTSERNRHEVIREEQVREALQKRDNEISELQARVSAAVAVAHELDNTRAECDRIRTEIDRHVLLTAERNTREVEKEEAQKIALEERDERIAVLENTVCLLHSQSLEHPGTTNYFSPLRNGSPKQIVSPTSLSNAPSFNGKHLPYQMRQEPRRNLLPAPQRLTLPPSAPSNKSLVSTALPSMSPSTRVSKVDDAMLTFPVPDALLEFNTPRYFYQQSDAQSGQKGSQAAREFVERQRRQLVGLQLELRESRLNEAKLEAECIEMQTHCYKLQQLLQAKANDEEASAQRHIYHDLMCAIQDLNSERIARAKAEEEVKGLQNECQLMEEMIMNHFSALKAFGQESLLHLENKQAMFPFAREIFAAMGTKFHGKLTRFESKGNATQVEQIRAEEDHVLCKWETFGLDSLRMIEDLKQIQDRLYTAIIDNHLHVDNVSHTAPQRKIQDIEHKTRMAATSAANKVLEETVSTLQDRLLQESEEKLEMEREIKRDRAEKNFAADQNRELKVQVVELGTSLENATAQSRAGEAQIAHLKDQVRQLTQKIQQETSKASSERSMRDAMLDLRQEELALQLDLQERELVSARSERDEAHAALVRVQVDSEAQITQLRASREQLQDDLKRADDSARRMSVQYDSEAAKCENLQLELHRTGQRMQQAMFELEKLEATLNQSNSTRDSMAEGLQNLKREKDSIIDHLQSECSRLQVELDMTRRECLRLEGMLGGAERDSNVENAVAHRRDWLSEQARNPKIHSQKGHAEQVRGRVSPQGRWAAGWSGREGSGGRGIEASLGGLGGGGRGSLRERSQGPLDLSDSSSVSGDEGGNRVES